MLFRSSYAFDKQNKIQPVISVFQNLATGKNNETGLNTGYGDFANSIYFDLFYEYNSHLLLNGNIGYQSHKKYFRNDFLGNIYINYSEKGKYQFSLFMRGKLPFGQEVSNNENITNYGLYKNAEGYFRYGALAEVAIRKQMSVNLSFENYIKGQFIGSKPIYTIGLHFLFDKSNNSDEK